MPAAALKLGDICPEPAFTFQRAAAEWSARKGGAGCFVIHTMAVHTVAQKEFIVKKLAAFEPPRAIALAFAAVFRDTKCDENDVLATDPANNVVAPELFALFISERERILLDPDSAPFANQKARLIALSNQAKFYGGNNQLDAQRTVFRQIAEEQGVIGAKGTGKATPAAAEPAVEVVAITRTIVDAAPVPA